MGVGAPKKLQRVLDHKGIANDIKSYPKVGHSFANKLPAQPLLRIGGFGYNQAATEDAWARVFSFFGEHLQQLIQAGRTSRPTLFFIPPRSLLNRLNTFPTMPYSRPIAS